MSNWFNTVTIKTDSILEKIKEHPFIIELMDGTLSKEIFQFYVNQDSLYLSEYKKTLAQLSIKCAAANDTQFFLDAATGIILVEDELHQVFLNKEYFNKEPSPSCELYTGYMSRIANNHSIEEGLAVILPCFTIYKEIGDYILANQTNKDNNPYQNWIQTYASEDFANAVLNAIEITNRYAEKAPEEVLNKMDLAFIKSSKLEWMFWDSAYNKEAWKI
ncbi:thiaminase II [Patiriisocius sp. Uisw_017]|jgi:thiaminase/transcriptional activator TenA|uniref:thiaminase II n=1 Tax=Patiriisocius sp. Uisw_017 TaxID=3230968 RepID=UPI0039EC3005